MIRVIYSNGMILEPARMSWKQLSKIVKRDLQTNKKYYGETYALATVLECDNNWHPIRPIKIFTTIKKED
jgi:hypothetical protein